MASCNSTAQATAFTALANSTNTPSPISFMMRPRCLETIGWKNFGTTRFERRQSGDLVTLHETAEADHVGGQNGGKTALGALFGHCCRGLLEASVPQTVVV